MDRPLFFLVPATGSGDLPPAGGALYRSGDGGQSWAEVSLPAGLIPTALEISPNFANDGLVFIGAADGRVVALEAAGLERR